MNKILKVINQWIDYILLRIDKKDSDMTDFELNLIMQNAKSISELEIRVYRLELEISSQNMERKR